MTWNSRIPESVYWRALEGDRGNGEYQPSGDQRMSSVYRDVEATVMAPEYSLVEEQS